jgi:hypothetical protein
MTTPSLSTTQISQISCSVANYIATQRAWVLAFLHYQPRITA